VFEEQTPESLRHSVDTNRIVVIAADPAEIREELLPRFKDANLHIEFIAPPRSTSEISKLVGKRCLILCPVDDLGWNASAFACHLAEKDSELLIIGYYCGKSPGYHGLPSAPFRQVVSIAEAAAVCEELMCGQHAAAEENFLRFWGVRGSIPVPGPTTVHYGGNTSCVELRWGNELLILDAGTGIRGLGAALENESAERGIEATLLISHTHWDHIQGLPFFVPAYRPKNRIRIIGFVGARRGLQTTLSDQMERPYFPIRMEQMPGTSEIEEVSEGDFRVGSFNITAAILNHPGASAGYRITLPNKRTIAFLPDFELLRSHCSPDPENKEVRHSGKASDESLLQLVKDADIALLDSQYTLAEYPARRGWGHNCMDDSVLICHQAGVKSLFLFHHDPSHSDEELREGLEHCRDLGKSLGSNLRIEAAQEGFRAAL
jgi:phosphoribosyl 1,2-cyclic phosphodiesterase